MNYSAESTKVNRQSRALAHSTSLAVIGPGNGGEIPSTAGYVNADAQTSAREHTNTHAAKVTKRHPEHVASGGGKAILDSTETLHTTTTDAAEIAKVMQLVAMLEKLWNLHDRCTRMVATADQDPDMKSIKRAFDFAFDQLDNATASSSDTRRRAIANAAAQTPNSEPNGPGADAHGTP